MPELSGVEQGVCVLPDGARLAYRRWGRGPPVYLLHGGPGGSGTYWPRALPWLGETHEVFALDMRGHGVSSRTPPYTIGRFADDLVAFADAQGHATPALLGHSLGALVALDAATRSDRWSRVVLVGGFSSTKRALAHPRGLFTKLALGARLVGWNLARMAGRPREPREFLRRLLLRAQPLFHGNSKRAAELDAILWESVLDPLDAVAPLQRDLLNWSVDARLPDVRVPTLIVEGAMDRIAPGAAARMARRIPGASLVMIPASGHSPFFDQPAAFRGAVEPFLSQVGPDLGESLTPMTTQGVSMMSDTDYRQRLSPLAYKVTRENGTERPFTGEHWNNHADGTYSCICCGSALFDSKAKFESGTGWPSFSQPATGAPIEERVDRALFMKRTEVRCRTCDAHLGHVFDDGPAPTGLRYCINSVALQFSKRA